MSSLNTAYLSAGGTLGTFERFVVFIGTAEFVGGEADIAGDVLKAAINLEDPESL